MTARYPFAVYTTAFGLLLVALALLHGMTRIAKHITRIECNANCCEIQSTGKIRKKYSVVLQEADGGAFGARADLGQLPALHLLLVSDKGVLEEFEGFFKATCWACSQEVELDQAALVLNRSTFISYMSWYRKEDTARVDCASCFAKKDSCELKVGPCGHYYCHPCLRRMCRLALGDRALLPLRCCKKELPQDYVHEALTKLDYEKYCKLMTEKDWKISDLQSDAEYTATVEALGAKQCPGCGIGVQRDFGCVHMTCPNGHQFCYTCLQRWGSCKCPLIPDDELRQILGE
ncbi:hypothetical protein BBO99_00003685 [Phytophthora kernoviae]|uniref:RING-type domain-containing protein n=2 Tax=Phytophthora kernoviae TaxID=325452 RepID=A0A3R7FYG0_9STRA|nr:hypothetical protein G195_006099 [Phytophthora kernoviae 00238/432]KAG2523481.1 hypothetical protein JM16_002274 [Phytophthora kernoviae]KAG2525424.1 hypothetical protein JM18_002338 [Phytophthora kernoviae]RLN10501.1 hypothetical protein BBI17_003697 [Phytophthora kernoviae]RLN81483.1 hypothetical protein BBO99_00003685 [Phytophthora kernoviae]